MVLAEKDAASETKVATTVASILLCAWRDIKADTVECLMQMQDKGWGWAIKRGDALISRSRSIAVSEWYRHTDEDVFLMIDDDVVWEPRGAESVVELAREKRTIVCAAYPVKDGRHLACRRLAGQEIIFGPGSEPVEIVYPATGFMAVHRDVIDAMVKWEEVFPLCSPEGLIPMWPFFDTFSMRHENGEYEYLSEDYAFGERARQLGFKIWLDPSVILFHMGMYPYNVFNMKRTKQLPTQIPTKDGFPILIPSEDEVIGNDIANQGSWDDETREAILEHLKPGWTFLDLGAHIGYYSLLAAQRGNPVIAVEPYPDSAELLRKNAELNGFDIEVHEVAIDDTYALAGMIPVQTNTGASYRVPAHTPGSLLVEAAPITAVLDGRRPEFIKIDVEGDEYRILASMPELESAKVILFEICDHQLERNSGVTRDQLFELLTNAGFEIKCVAERPHVGYSDWIAVKR